ncbi:MAG: Ku protein [Hyphomicrobiales bacterium]|nr:Ku protein [Hyphomicrobiales bacterium]
MAARAYWKGYLKLSLVSCSISVNPATTSSERVSFRQINKETGNRLRQQLVDEVTREAVEAENKGRGYEVDKGVFIPVEDEEIEALQIESTHTIEIDSFVPAAQIDKRYYDSPYYVYPNDQVGQEAFAVIRDAMKGQDMVALGRIVLNKRERVMAIEPFGKGLIGTTLHYAYEVRDAADYFDDIADVKVAGEMLKLAQHIMETKAADFDPTAFEDRYEIALVEMLRKKQAGYKPPKTKERAPAAPNVINLMDALRQSIAAGRRTPAAGRAAAPSKRGKKRATGQRELLLPIEGRKAREPKEAKDVKEAKKPAARAAARTRKAG